MVGDRIRTARHFRGMTQAELARRVGVEKSVISHFEANRKDVSNATLAKIADALDLRLEHFLDSEALLSRISGCLLTLPPEKQREVYQFCQSLCGGQP